MPDYVATKIPAVRAQGEGYEPGNAEEVFFFDL